MPAAVPGLAGIEHIGLTVPDLDAATRFLADVAGGEALYDIGPFARPEDWMATHLARPHGRSIHRMRVLRIANGPVLELIELAADGTGRPTRACAETAPDAAWHLAFYVEDMEQALVALKAHGVEIQSGPVVMTEGPSAGLSWLYFRAPWGLQLELVSYPGGIAAYRGRANEVWRPR